MPISAAHDYHILCLLPSPHTKKGPRYVILIEHQCTRINLLQWRNLQPAEADSSLRSPQLLHGLAVSWALGHRTKASMTTLPCYQRAGIGLQYPTFGSEIQKQGWSLSLTSKPDLT